LAGTVAAPVLQDQLTKAGITGPLSDILVSIGSTAIGSAVGGTAGAAGALNEVQNNYLTPRENLARNRAAATCASSNFTDTKACGEANRLNTLDRQRDAQISAAVASCQTSKNPQTCIDASRMVYQLQNLGMQELQQLAVELAPTCAPPRDCTQAANWGSTELSTLYTANNSLRPYIASGAVLPTVGPVEVVGAGVLTIPRVGLGAALGSGFDAAGQYTISYIQTGTGTVRIEQSLFAGLTGGVALPLTTGRGVLVGAAVGAGTAGTNTTFNNWMYDENTSIFLASLLGAGAGALGPRVGNWTTNRITYTPTFPVSGTIPRIPTQPSIGAPFAPQIGNGVSNTMGGVPSFIPLSPNIPSQSGGRK
jgi:hypothetical protein